MFGLGGGLNHNFNYDVNEVDYNSSDQWNNSIGGMQNTAGQMNQAQRQYGGLMEDYTGMSKNLYQQGLDRMGPDSQFVTDSQNMFREDLDASNSTQMRNIGQMLAQQGVGGGIRGIMESGNQTGDTLRKSRLGFQEQGFQQGASLLNSGAQYGQIGQGFGGLQSNTLGNKGSLQNNISNQYNMQDERMTNVALANAGAQNTRNQYANNMNFENKAYNQNRQDAWKNSLLTGGLGIAGAALGGPMGAAVGKGIAGMFSDSVDT
mgnify:CR=1 FL=1|tara:strand:- start:10007 stop:10792 length:786 start_codon:yes stop_codon:yes gene_type:complete